MTITCSEEGYRVVAGACRRHSGQVRVEGQDGFADDRKLATERCVDVKAAKVFPDLGEFGVDAVQAGGDEVEASGAGSGEAALDVLHEFASGRYFNF